MATRYKQARFRFYEELNDFLPQEKRKKAFTVSFSDKPSIKDIIEALGIRHSEIDLILVNGQSVDFCYPLQEGDAVAVYPTFKSINITPLIRLREMPLRELKFVLDVHLGKLAKCLRLLGFDVSYDKQASDQEIIHCSVKEKRCILTRDIELLKNKKVVRGYWVRVTDPFEQIKEVLERFDLSGNIQPFTRCLKCNILLSL